MFAVRREYPDYLKHSDHDTPVPTWAQVTRSMTAPNRGRIAQVARLVADTADECAARAVWQSWPGNYQRSTALVIDKLDDEGWLDSIDHLDGWPWDGGFYCWPRATVRGQFTEVLN